MELTIATLVSLELQGLVKRHECLNGNDSYSLTQKGRARAMRVLACLGSEDLTIIGMLVGNLVTETNE